MDTLTLAEKEGWLYIKYTTTSYTEPKQISHYWPTAVRLYDLAQRLGSMESAQALIGQHMQHLGNGVYRGKQCGMTYRTVDGAQTLPEFSETEDVFEPKQRGKKLPTRWYDGCWQKETARGWVAA